MTDEDKKFFFLGERKNAGGRAGGSGLIADEKAEAVWEEERGEWGNS